MNSKLASRKLSFLLLILIAASCNNRSNRIAPVAPAPAIITQPDLTANPDPAVPLSGILTVTTDIPTTVELGFDDGVRQWTVVADATLATDHARVPVLGIRQDRITEIEVTVRSASGSATVAASKLTFTPTPLPALFPPLETTISDPAFMEPGYTLFNSFVFGSVLEAFLVMVDETGSVVWYYDGTKSPLTVGNSFTFFPLPNGNLMLISGRNLAIEINLLGDVVQTWWANRLATPGAPAGATIVDMETFHHEIAALPPGEDADFLVLGSELRVLPNYPADEVDPTMTNPSSEVVGDTIVEFKRDGTVVRELKLFDILDPYRVSYESLSNFWNTSYPASGDTEDWSHANALVFDPSDNTYIVSVRHQDVVIKIERDTGKLVWLLGDPGRWNAPWNNSLLMPRLGAQFEFNYHQHAPEITASGNILLFDNGNNRAIPPVPPLPFDASYSRAVEYQIDPVTMTFEQVWAYGGMFDPGHSFYSFFLGDANQLPVTGNVLVTDGGKRNANLLRFGRIAEVTHASPPREVFELIIRDNAAVDPVHYAVYRSHRLSSLY